MSGSGHFRLMQRSKQHPYSITSSARAEQRRRNVEAERLGGLEVDREPVLRRRLYWQVGRFLALEDAIYVPGREPVLVGDIRPVGCQTAVSDVKGEWVDCGQSVSGRERNDQFATGAPSGPVRIKPPFGARANAVMACSTSPASCKSIELISTPKRRRHALDGAQLGHRGGIPHDRVGLPPASRAAQSPSAVPAISRSDQIRMR